MISNNFSYAKAIGLSCANEIEKENWMVFLESLDFLTSSDLFKRWFYDPTISLDHKNSKILSFFPNIDLQKSNFICLLVKEKKLDDLQDILSALKLYFIATSDTLKAVLKTSYLLDNKDLCVIEKFLTNRYKKKVVFEQQVKNIIGIEIEVGNDLINYTATSLLQRLVTSLKQGSAL